MRVLVSTTAGAGHLGPIVPFARALVDAGHEVVVAAPASFAASVEKAGFTHAPFADAPPEELAAVFARLPGLSNRDANALVMTEVFGRIDARAALPGVQALVDRWRPDLVLRDSAEFASYVVADSEGIPHATVAVSLESFEEESLAALEVPLADLGARSGVAGLRSATRLSLLPPAFDGAAALASGTTKRFRDDAAPAASGASLPDWWPGSSDPLVYVTFGSVAAAFGLFPVLYQGVVAAVADLPVRVLMTLGEAGDPEALGPAAGQRPRRAVVAPGRRHAPRRGVGRPRRLRDDAGRPGRRRPPGGRAPLRRPALQRGTGGGGRARASPSRAGRRPSAGWPTPSNRSSTGTGTGPAPSGWPSRSPASHPRPRRCRCWRRSPATARSLTSGFPLSDGCTERFTTHRGRFGPQTSAGALYGLSFPRLASIREVGLVERSQLVVSVTSTRRSTSAAPRPAQKINTQDSEKAYLAKWMRVWVALLCVVTLVVVGYLTVITNSLANVNGNLGTVSREVGSAGTNTVEPAQPRRHASTARWARSTPPSSPSRARPAPSWAPSRRSTTSSGRPTAPWPRWPAPSRPCSARWVASATS